MKKITELALTVADTGLNVTGDKVYGGPPLSAGEFIGENIITPALGLAGVLFFVLFIYGGFMWMTARGNTTQAEKAKTILMNTIIGLVIVLTAYAVTRFIFTSFT